MARRGLLDGTGDEPGHPRRRRALRVDVEPELRGPAGSWWTHPPRVAGSRRGDGHRWTLCSPRGSVVRAVRRVSGRAMPLDRADVDTDQIIPAHWLKRVERTGYGAGLFEAWRRDPAFVMNDPRYAGATILVAGANFGSGSSREDAVLRLCEHRL